jgi:hypothetical protein
MGGNSTRLLLAVLCGVILTCFLRPADAGPGEEGAWWKTARGKMEAVLAKQGRTPADLESPKWFEVPYSTVGRMPLIDTGLREPLVLPEIALWADDRAKAAEGSLVKLLTLAREMSEETCFDPPPLPPAGSPPDWVASVPAEIRDVFAFLYDRLAVAARLREEAFFALSPDLLTYPPRELSGSDAREGCGAATLPSSRDPGNAIVPCRGG